MLNLIRGGNVDGEETQEDDSSSEEVLAIFVLYEHCIVTFRRILRAARVQSVARVPALRRFSSSPQHFQVAMMFRGC